MGYGEGTQARTTQRALQKWKTEVDNRERVTMRGVIEQKMGVTG